MTFPDYNDILGILQKIYMSIVNRLDGKMDKLVPSTNVTITDDGHISAIDTKYVAGCGLDISSKNVITRQRVYRWWPSISMNDMYGQPQGITSVRCLCDDTLISVVNTYNITDSYDSGISKLTATSLTGGYLELFAYDDDVVCHQAFSITVYKHGKPYTFTCTMHSEYGHMSGSIPGKELVLNTTLDWNLRGIHTGNSCYVYLEVPTDYNGDIIVQPLKYLGCEVDTFNGTERVPLGTTDIEKNIVEDVIEGVELRYILRHVEIIHDFETALVDTTYIDENLINEFLITNLQYSL